jgi:hypothetical protein
VERPASRADPQIKDLRGAAAVGKDRYAGRNGGRRVRHPVDRGE